jgi:ferredoxin
MKCATDCPSQAITYDQRTTDAPTVSNNAGVRKWPVNPEQCYKYWIANRLDCANCIRVCPFNQEQGWHHDLVRSLIRNVPQLNPLVLRIGDLLGYGERRAPSTIWEDRQA